MLSYKLLHEFQFHIAKNLAETSQPKNTPQNIRLHGRISAEKFHLPAENRNIRSPYIPTDE